MSDYTRIDECLHEIKILQIDAMTEIRRKLAAWLPNGASVSNLKRGLLTGKNDYRNYVWLSVMSGGKEYWISSTYLDVDIKSGNIHVQIGRLQFWKNVSENSKGAVTSPNRKTDDGRHFMFCPENSFDPGICLYDEDYNPDKVIEKFMQFLEETK